MTCGHCKAAVESAIKATEGVQAAQVDLKAGNATVGGTFADAAIIESIKEAASGATRWVAVERRRKRREQVMRIAEQRW